MIGRLVQQALCNGQICPYVENSEVPNRRADRNKRAGLEKSATVLAYLLGKVINEQGEFFVYYMKNFEQGGKKT